MRYWPGGQFLPLTGGNLTGNVVLANNIALRGLDTGAVSRHLARIDAADIGVLGDGALEWYFDHSGTFEENDGSGAKAIWSERHLIRVDKPAIQVVNNSTTLVVDNHLVFAAPANTSWFIRFFLRILSTPAADIKLGLAGTASTSGAYRLLNDGNIIITQKAAADITSVETDGSNQLLVMEVQVDVGATPGTIGLMWAQLAADVSDTTMLTRSVMTAIRTR